MSVISGQEIKVGLVAVIKQVGAPVGGKSVIKPKRHLSNFGKMIFITDNTYFEFLIHSMLARGDQKKLFMVKMNDCICMKFLML
jgi:hypothetical protein